MASDGDSYPIERVYGIWMKTNYAGIFNQMKLTSGSSLQ